MGNTVVHDSQLNGHYTHDYHLMMEMDDDELFDVCQTNHFAKQVCDSDNFWHVRINTYLYNNFPFMFLYHGDYKKIYQHLLYHRYDIVLKIIYAHASDDAIDDFEDWLDNHPEFYITHA